MGSLAYRGVGLQAPRLPKVWEKLGSYCLLTSPLSSFSKDSGPCCPAQSFKTKLGLTVEKHACPVAHWEAVHFQSISVLNQWKNPSRDVQGSEGRRLSWSCVPGLWFWPGGSSHSLPSSSLPDKAAFTEAQGREVASPSGFPELCSLKLAQLLPFIDEETEARGVKSPAQGHTRKRRVLNLNLALSDPIAQPQRSHCLHSWTLSHWV